MTLYITQLIYNIYIYINYYTLIKNKKNKKNKYIGLSVNANNPLSASTLRVDADRVIVAYWCPLLWTLIPLPKIKK